MGGDSGALIINTKASLVQDSIRRPKSINFQVRNQLFIPPEQSLLQGVICLAKPEVSFSDNKVIEGINRVKLDGVMLTDDLKWNQNTEYICAKAIG